MHKHKALAGICGWYGVLALLGAYICLTWGVFESTNLSYQVLNLTGSLGIIAEALSKKDWQPTVLNLVWALVAAFAVINIILS